MSKRDLREHLGLVLVDKMVHNQARKNQRRRMIIMEKVKEMPYEEKYRMVIDQMKFGETFVVPLLQKHLGDQEVADFKKTRQEGAKPIPEGASFEEKYEIAYSNWIWMAKSTYSFIRKKMGEEGIKKFERAEVEALKRKNAGPALFLLGFIRVFSPGLAFTTMTRKMTYQLQWISPLAHCPS
jgi:hypothetical protein